MRNEPNTQTVVGVFPNRPEAEDAVDDLRSAGFKEDQIGILTRDAEKTDVETETVKEGSKAGSGAATGAVVGGLVGAAASLLIPGIGPVIAGGILATVLGSAAIGAAAGGILGGLVGLGVPEEEATYYEGEFKAGRTLVTVKANDRYDEARKILRDAGARDVHDQDGSTPISSGRARTAGLTSTASANTMKSSESMNRPASGSGKETKIPIVEEELTTRKQAEEVGEVNVQRRIVEEQRTMNVPVTREEVHVERRPADRPLAPGEKAFTGDSIRMPIVEEEVIVQKQQHVVGEVVVTREKITEDKPVTGTVRREEVDVKRSDDRSRGGAQTWEAAMPTYRSTWQQRYGNQGGTWEAAMPAYQYGHNANQSSRYSGKNWDAVEPDLRRDWEQRYPATPWDKVKMFIRETWNTGRGASV